MATLETHVNSAVSEERTISLPTLRAPHEYANRLTMYMKRTGIGTKEMAEACHLGVRTIQRVSKGYTLPTLSTRVAIEQYLSQHPAQRLYKPRC